MSNELFTTADLYEENVRLRERLKCLEQERQQLQNPDAAQAAQMLIHEALMRSSKSICVLEGPDYIFRLANAGFEALFGQRIYIGLPFREVFYDLDDQTFTTTLDRVIAAKNGDIRWMRDNSRAVWQAEQELTTHIYGATQDVTEQKQAETALRASEQMLHAILDTSPDLIVLADMDGVIQWVSASASEILGYSVDDSLGRNEMEFVHPDDMLTFQNTLEELSINKSHTAEARYRVRHADGRWIFVENRMRLIFGADQQPEGFVAIIRDVTKQVQVETYLRHARATAETAARQKDEFLPSMSHELRTPLNAVLGLSEVLQEGVYGTLNDQQRVALQSIEESGRHLLDLINDILDVAKIEAGKVKLATDTVPVGSLCTASLRLIKRDAEKKRLTVESSIDPAVTAVQADQRRLKQILVNLLSNAVKFTPQNGCIGLEVKGDREHHTVTFTVWDTGIGIEPEDQERLFKPFTQLDSSLTRQYPGTGLGLALVARLTELHNGSVTIESAVGQGSRFIVTLPWSESAQTSIAEVDHEPPVAPKPLDLGGIIRRSLVIEDSPPTIEQITRYLGELSIDASVCTRGAEALPQAISTQPDIIMLDINLPDMSGWDLLRALKLEPQTRDIPTLVVSVVDDRPRGLELGAAEYIVKPLSRYQLRESLHKVAPLISQRRHIELPHLPLGRPFDSETPRILLAEDNLSNIEMMRRYLERQGYHVMIAVNGKEAIQRIQEDRPDLILMDIQMPGIDGLEAIRRIRADAALATLPVVAVTALVMPGDRERCLAAGANDYLSKPVSMRRLAQVIQTYLDPDNKK